jgi:hypothetical protein
LPTLKNQAVGARVLAPAWDLAMVWEELAAEVVVLVVAQAIAAPE